MKWKDALFKQSKSNCNESLPVAKKNTADRVPPDDAEAGILCKDKVRRGKKDHWCSDDCPKGNKRKWWQ